MRPETKTMSDILWYVVRDDDGLSGVKLWTMG